jgi:hypothetical protein
VLRLPRAESAAILLYGNGGTAERPDVNNTVEQARFRACAPSLYSEREREIAERRGGRGQESEREVSFPRKEREKRERKKGARAESEGDAMQARAGVAPPVSEGAPLGQQQ